MALQHAEADVVLVPDAATIRAGLIETGLAEAEFYRSHGLLTDLLKLNAI